MYKNSEKCGPEAKEICPMVQLLIAADGLVYQVLEER
jgi:hypothetical protein